MRGFAAPKVYRSFEEFERDELRKLDGLHISIDDMLDEMFADELDFEPASKPSKRETTMTISDRRSRSIVALADGSSAPRSPRSSLREIAIARQSLISSHRADC